MIESGELSLGEPCVPHQITKYVCENGQVERKKVTVTGRKFPLTDLCHRLLQRHEAYMWLNKDSEIDSMTPTELCSLSPHYSPMVKDQEISIGDLKEAIKCT